MSHRSNKPPVILSIGVLAGRESDGLSDALESLFRQSVFERVLGRHQQCEVIVVAEAGADRAVAVARDVVERLTRTPGGGEAVSARVIELPDAGRAGAWNRFVHELSAVEARFLCLLEPDVVFPHRDTLHHLLTTLERKPHMPVAVGRPCSDLLCKSRPSAGERLALTVQALAGTEQRRIDRHLYCLRAAVARAILLPRELEGAEEAFIQEVICTDFMVRDATRMRIALVAEAAYLHRGARTLRAALAGEEREFARRAAVDAALAHLKSLPCEERVHLADAVRELDAADPDWLKRGLAAQLHGGRPGIGGVVRVWRERISPLARRSWPQRMGGLTLAALAAAGSLLAARRARRNLQRTLTQQLADGARTVRTSVPQATK